MEERFMDFPRNSKGQFYPGYKSPKKGLPIETSHKIGCQCSVCLVKRGELKGKSHPAFGHKKTTIEKQKMASRKKGRKNLMWKGGKAWYNSLHNWVRKYLGKPEICEHCGKTGLTSHQIHWSNKSGNYLKNTSDWIRLCAKCHGSYDKENKLRVYGKGSRKFISKKAYLNRI
jgi:hypothetical protein